MTTKTCGLLSLVCGAALGSPMIPFRRSLAIACAATVALGLARGEANAGAEFAQIPSGSGSGNANGWAAGGHAGYNWQQGMAVFGFETDLQATRLHAVPDGMLAFAPFPGCNCPGALAAGTAFAQTTGSIDWYGTVRGRLGIAAGPWLVYDTAGLAYGNVNLSSKFGFSSVLPAGSPFSTNLLVTETKTGWVAGAGFEYLVRPNVSVGLSYQYVDLGSLSGTSSAAGTAFFTPVTLTQLASAHAQFQTVMASLSWQFAPQPASGPWAGAYVGGRAGGAWGNNTSGVYNSDVFFSDLRLKRDIALVGRRRDDGLGIYSFKYLWSDATYVGVMAQEVALIHPEAVVRDALSGYLAVDYGRLDLPLMMLK